MLMVVSVIAMNTYIYLPTKEVEKAENIPPSPTVKRTETPTETPTIIEETPSPSPKATVQITPSPSPSDSPTPTPSPTPSPTQTPIEPPPRTPTPTLTRTPNPCTDAMRQQEQIIIKNSNGSFWEASINMKKQSILDEYERKYQQPVAAELTVLSDEISITVNSDCKTANVSVPYFWTVFRQLPNGRKEPPIKIFTSRNFSCRKDSVWKCA